MSFFAPIVANLWETIESYGVNPRPFFEAEGVNITLPLNPSERIPVDKIIRIVRAATEGVDDKLFGLRVGQNIHPSHLGALGFAWLASSSLNEGFDRLQRYIRLLNPAIKLLINADSDTVKITYVLDIELENQSIRADSQLAALVSMSRMIAGKAFNPTSIEFVYEQPDDTSEYFAFFKCPIVYGASGNSIFVAKSDWERILPTGNVQLAKINDQVVIKRLAALDKEDIVSRVKAAIINALPSGEISDDLIAAELNMTTRTMRRRLQDEQRTFRGVLTGIRQEIAEQYIQDKSITLTEVSYLLGFSETSSFSRAFKSWTGKAPSEARTEALSVQTN